MYTRRNISDKSPFRSYSEFNIQVLPVTYGKLVLPFFRCPKENTTDTKIAIVVDEPYLLSDLDDDKHKQIKRRITELGGADEASNVILGKVAGINCIIAMLRRLCLVKHAPRELLVVPYGITSG